MARAEPLTTVEPWKEAALDQHCSSFIDALFLRRTHPEEHVGHILLDGALIRNDIKALANTHALARENRLVDTERGAREAENTAVGGDLVADRDRDDVAGDKGGCVDLLETTGPENTRLVGRVLLESLEGVGEGGGTWGRSDIWNSCERARNGRAMPSREVEMRHGCPRKRSRVQVSWITGKEK